jgi:polyvinyl alcohol dehydrogenase (cytochrome)
MPVTEVPEPPPVQGSPHWISYGNGAKNQFYNPVETKISVDTASKLTQRWSIQIGEVTGAPAVVGDRLFVASNAGLFAIDANDGHTLWMADIRSTSSPFYDEGTKTLFVSATNGNLGAFDAESGSMKWIGRISMQAGTTGWSSPVVSGALVVVGVGANESIGAFKGGMAAFDKETGAKQWEYTHCTTAGASVWSGPGADDGGVLYATTGNNYVQTDDRSNSIFAVMPGSRAGALAWTYQGTAKDGWTFNGGQGPDEDFGSNPIILDLGGRNLLAAGQKSGHFYLLDRSNGQLIAKQELCGATYPATGGILNNGAYDGKNQLFIVGANEAQQPGNTYGLQAAPDKMLEIVWKKPNKSLLWAPISSANGVCFVPDNTTMRVLNCMTGAELAAFDVPGTIGSAAAISDGRVFFGAGFTFSLGPVMRGRSLIALGLP